MGLLAFLCIHRLSTVAADADSDGRRRHADEERMELEVQILDACGRSCYG